MESDDFNLQNLREWQLVNDVLQKIPPKIQRGFFNQDLNVTCIDVLSEYLGIGSDVGIIFWYNRRNGNVQKLRTESTASITCIKLISSVEYMVAAGNAHGEVTIFQIQKELPTELIADKLAAALIHSKPIERYTVKDACRGSITCLEWSKNGMKLFSGDSRGIVVLTEFDFIQQICKSMEVINEKFAIVQMQFSSPWLLISTLYRAIVARKDDGNEWKVSQIGQTDRKVLNDFGAVFTPIVDLDHRKPPSIICARPGFRFWLADINGNVSHTFLLKDSIADVRSIFEIPLLNPVHNKVVNMKDSYFGPCCYFLGKFIVTYCDCMVFIVDVDKLKVMATIRRLRKIQYLSVNGNEIFIVEGGRSIVRIATAPEQQHQQQQQQATLGGNGNCSTQYVSSNHINNLMSNEANIEIQEETVAQADECFELPPIERIRLDIPLACRMGEHNLLNEDKLLLKHSRKLEVFEKINTLEYDDSILFQASTKKKKKTPMRPLSKTAAVAAAANASATDDVARIDGVVEIGRQAELFDNQNPKQHITNGSKPSPSMKSISENGSFNELTTKPCSMLASFCDGINNVQEKPIGNGTANNKSSHSPHKSSTKISVSQFELNYPNYPTVARSLSNEIASNPKSNGSTSTEAKQTLFNEIPLTSDEDDSIDDDGDDIDSLNAIKQCANNHTPTKRRPSELSESILSSDTTNPITTKDDRHDPKMRKFPNLSDIPKLWDMKIEKCDENQYNGGGGARHTSGHTANGSKTKEGIENEWVFL